MERKQRRGNANERSSRRSYPGYVRNTAKIQKYKSTKRRGLTALTGVARQREKLLLKRAGRPIVSRRKGNHLCRYYNKKVMFALGFLQMLSTNYRVYFSIDPSINLGSIYSCRKFAADDRSLRSFHFFFNHNHV